MIQLLKNHFYVGLFVLLAACSSNTNVGQDDLSISEIEDIEKTGEFSEDDFFKDEEILKESGVALDIEGLDDKNLGSKSNDLVSDIDVEDFEGESFNKEDDFETDLESSNSVAEFDEFDEFVTTDKVAKNEDIITQEAPSIGDIAEQPTMTEEDIFSEFEESIDVADKKVDPSVQSALDSNMDFNIEEVPVQSSNQPNLDFEDAFQESETSMDTDFATNDVNVDTTLDTEVDISSAQNAAKDQFEDVFSEDSVAGNNFDSDFGPGPAPIVEDIPSSEVLNISDARENRTAKEILGNQYYEKPQQIVTAIKQQVQSWIPVKKMREEPYDQDGILLNALYIVREGENFKDIGDKIYGKGSINNLSKLNPFLNPRKLKVGEKVYYNSPNRPTDNNSMLFYYDDIGRRAQYRQIEAGENIRTVAQQLLGHPRSWMEIWATNPEVVSKAEVERGYRIKYFSKDDEQSMVMGNEDEAVTSTANDTQINTDLDTQNEIPDMADTQDPVVDDGLSTDPAFDEPVVNPEETIAENGFDEPMINDTAATNTEENFDQGFDQPAQNPDIGGIPESLNNRPVQEAGGLKALYMGLDQKTVEMIGMAGGGLILMILLLMYARRRRMYSQATQVQDFDFTGSTKIDEQTKTHIDI